MSKQNQGSDGADHSGYPRQIANSIEALTNILYLVDMKADDAKSVRQLIGLASPAMDALKQIVHPSVHRGGNGKGDDAKF